MYIENPERRTTVTNEFRKYIKVSRIRTGRSAVAVANAINRPQSWLAQIENGRTKTINNFDLVQLISVLEQCSIEDADSFLSQRYKELFENSLSNDAIENSDLDIGDDTVTNLDEINQNDISKYKVALEDANIFERSLETINNIFKMVNKKDPFEAQKMLLRLLKSCRMDIGLIVAYIQMPLYLFENLTRNEKQSFLDEVADVCRKYAKQSKSKDEPSDPNK